jgi:hypothetical protein
MGDFLFRKEDGGATVFYQHVWMKTGFSQNAIL